MDWVLTCIASLIPLLKFGQFFTTLLHIPYLVKLDGKSIILLAMTYHEMLKNITITNFYIVVSDDSSF